MVDSKTTIIIVIVVLLGLSGYVGYYQYQQSSGFQQKASDLEAENDVLMVF